MPSVATATHALRTSLMHCLQCSLRAFTATTAGIRSPTLAIIKPALPLFGCCLQVLELRLQQWLAAGRACLVVGDLNISPAPIDSCHPPADFDAQRSDRLWLQQLLAPHGPGVVDAFRLHHPSRCGWLGGWGVQPVGWVIGGGFGLTRLRASSAVYHAAAGYVYSLSGARGDASCSSSAVSFCGPCFSSTLSALRCRRNAFTCWNTVTGARVNNYGEDCYCSIASCHSMLICQMQFTPLRRARCAPKTTVTQAAAVEAVQSDASPCPAIICAPNVPWHHREPSCWPCCRHPHRSHSGSRADTSRPVSRSNISSAKR